MEVLYTKLALQSLDNAFEYIEANNRAAAFKIINKIYNSIELISNHPYIGPVGRRANTRELYIPTTKYILVYRVLAKKDTIAITNLLHTSQQY